MKKLTLFLNVFMLSIFYSNALACGNIDFPRVLPDSVCTSDTILLATDQEIGNNSIDGNGVFYNQGFYFSPQVADVGNRIFIKVYGQDTCNQFVQDSVSVLVKNCEYCTQFNNFTNPLPDTICNTDNPILIANGNDFEDVIPFSPYIEQINEDFYFNPALSSTDTTFTVAIKVFNACQDSFYVEQLIHVDDCSPNCETVSFINSLPDSVCNDSSNSIYLTSSAIYDAPIHVIGKGVIAEAQNGGSLLDSVYYFDPSLVDPSDYNQSLPILIQAYDQCQSQAIDSIMVYDCESNNCITYDEFANPLPDTICNTDDPILLVNGDDFEDVILFNLFIEQINEDFYFNPALSSTDTTFTVAIKVFNACQDSFYVEQLVHVDDCAPDCGTPQFANALPDEICNDDSAIYLASTSDFTFPIKVRGEGVVALPLNGGVDSAYYFDPSMVSRFLPQFPHVYITAQDDCGYYVQDSTIVNPCTDTCSVLTEFEYTIPDTICNTDNPVLLVNGNDFENVVPFSPYIEYVNGDFYFNPALSATDTTFTVGIKVFNACQDSFYVEQLVHVDDCSPNCETVSFINSLPDSVCNDSSNSIYLTSSAIYDAPIHVIGKGVIAEAQNGGSLLDSVYYFDPSLVDPSDFNQSLPILIQAYDQCQSQAIDSIMVYDCESNNCITYDEFANPLPDTICNTANPVLLVNGNDFENVVPFSPYIEYVNGAFYFNPALSATDTTFTVGIKVFNACQDSFYVEQLVHVDDCAPDCGTPQFTNSLPEEVCSNDPRIYLTSTQTYDFSISVAGNGVVSEAVNGGLDTAYYFDPMSVNGALPQYPLIMIRAEDDCRNYVLDSTEVRTCIDSCAITPEFPYPLPDSICYSTNPIILDLLNTLDIWGDGIVYDGNVEFDPSVPALNHHAVVYASVENYCQEEVVVSDTIFIKPCKINSIHDFSGTEISVFPNPVRNQLTISGEGIESIQLRDLTGKAVIIQESSTLNVSNLSKGIYFLQIELENGAIKTEKIVKE